MQTKRSQLHGFKRWVTLLNHDGVAGAEKQYDFPTKNNGFPPFENVGRNAELLHHPERQQRKREKYICDVHRECKPCGYLPPNKYGYLGADSSYQNRHNCFVL
ncbi:MAG: hypothetical protein EOP49_34455 [Sphingobacteriales bacterium]|nr:MAG: hypothetical protein EOP49_34455 [Sphingobacteriales bacterium]